MFFKGSKIQDKMQYCSDQKNPAQPFVNIFVQSGVCMEKEKNAGHGGQQEGSCGYGGNPVSCHLHGKNV
jgi:hypothetical protein